MPEEARMTKLSRHLLYEDVAESVSQLIRERGLWGSYLPPEREMARVLGVNRGTLRKGLDLLEGQGLISRRQGRGTRVLPRNGRSRSAQERRVAVASFVRLPAKAFFGGIMAGLTLGASDAAWNVNFHSGLRHAERWEKFISSLDEDALDGLILVSFTEREAVEEVLRRWRGPAVMVDHYFRDLPLTGVIDDSRAGARKATEHLLSLGHRRIGYLDVSDPATNPWRHAGYLEALRSAGLEPDEGLRVGCHSDIGEARKAGAELLSRPRPPTAVLAFDDTRAWGLWQAAEARGLEVGRDLAIVGYGDGPPPAGFAAEMSTVHIEPRRMGEAAVSELEKIIDGKARPGEMVLLPAELIVRKSSGGAGAKEQR